MLLWLVDCADALYIFVCFSCIAVCMRVYGYLRMLIFQADFNEGVQEMSSKEL